MQQTRNKPCATDAPVVRQVTHQPDEGNMALIIEILSLEMEGINREARR